MASKKSSPQVEVPITRREVLKGAAALAAAGAGTALGCDAGSGGDLPTGGVGVGDNLSTAGRVAIVGGGAGGIAAAYFLSGTVGVDIFEARGQIGGHCESHTISYQGQPITVDLGAQFFHPDTHPIYVALLEELGLYDPDHPDTDQTIEAPGSLCIYPVAGGAPTFSSTHPLSTPFVAIDFAVYSQFARQAVLTNMPYEVTVDDWIRSLPVTQSFKNTILYPWITSLIGCSRANALRASARSILQTFALAFPANIFQGATTYNSAIGLQGNLQRMLDRAPGAQVFVNAPAQALSFDAASGWFVTTPAGRQGPYRAVVLNAPPLTGRELLRPLSAYADVTALLDVYEYFQSRLLIHTDPTYVQRDRSNWAAYNAGVDGLECEGSAWLGAFHEKLPTGGTVDVFKSWAERRHADPTEILLQRTFQHPLISKSTIAAARGLRPLQGRNGLYFSGQYTTGMDLQEAAVYSAMKVAAALAPASPTLASLNARLTASGHTGISYDL
ncbi:MAG TPA: FAD-dependent oxidoreductase [Polyangia bacterium]|jgi:predicted NAD/FAD-binding protein|nr:FAD-dependent oxidoreductase [Polyangia bacterium]